MSDFQNFAKNPFQAEIFSRGLSHFRIDQKNSPYENFRKRPTLARVMERRSQITFWRQIQIFWREKFLVSKMRESPTQNLANDTLRSSVGANNSEKTVPQIFAHSENGPKTIKVG